MYKGIGIRLLDQFFIEVVIIFISFNIKRNSEEETLDLEPLNLYPYMLSRLGYVCITLFCLHVKFLLREEKNFKLDAIIK